MRFSDIDIQILLSIFGSTGVMNIVAHRKTAATALQTAAAIKHIVVGTGKRPHRTSRKHRFRVVIWSSEVVTHRPVDWPWRGARHTIVAFTN